MDLASQIRRELKKIGASQLQISKGSGVSQTNVCRILSKGSIPRLDTAEALIRYIKKVNPDAKIELKDSAAQSGPVIEIETEWDDVPKYATTGAAAVDLRACIDAPMTLYPIDNAVMVPTGVSLNASGTGLAMMVIPRSSLGHKFGVHLANTVGLIDEDYQGEIMLSMTMRGGLHDRYVINPGDRIAQMIFFKPERPQLVMVKEFSSKTARGDGAFGSTGK